MKILTIKTKNMNDMTTIVSKIEGMIGEEIRFIEVTEDEESKA